MLASEGEAPPWSGPRPFVGRAGVLRSLAAHLDAALSEGGRALFLLGDAGAGKTACIQAFQEEAFRQHRTVQIGYADCARSLPGYRPWAQLADSLTRAHRLKHSARTLTPYWLNVVPIVGPIVSAVAATVLRVVKGAPLSSGPPPPEPLRASGLAGVRAVLEYGPAEPRLVILDSLDRGDSEDLSGAFTLIRHLEETRTLFLVGVRTTNGLPPPAARDLVLEAERAGRSHRVALAGLDPRALHEILTLATRGPVPDDWLQWVTAESGGKPGALWRLLGALEHAGQLRKVGRHWIWSGSPPSRSVAPPQGAAETSALSEDDRRLLALAAAEGPIFHSAVLSELAGIPELEVEDRLSSLCRAGIVEYRGEVSVGSDVTSQYAFRSAQDCTAFGARLSDAERAGLEVQARAIRRRLGLMGLSRAD